MPPCLTWPFPVTIFSAFELLPSASAIRANISQEETDSEIKQIPEGLYGGTAKLFACFLDKIH